MESAWMIVISALGISTFLNIFLKRISIPPIVGYIFTGVVLMQVFGHELKGDEGISHIAELGIAFLMFTIGLELPLNHLKKMSSDMIGNGSLQVIASIAFFSAMAFHVFDFSLVTSFVIGSAFALSSTAIVLKIFNDNNYTNRTFGQKALAILIFQDLAVIPILIAIQLLSNNSVSLWERLSDTLVSIISVLLVLFLVGKFIVRKFLGLAAHTYSKEIFISAILLLVIGSAILAHSFGLSYSLGAFIAGMIIAETDYKYQIEADLIPFRDLLLGLFFLSVGFQIDLNVLWHNGFLIALIVALVMICKAGIIYFIIARQTPQKAALKTAVSLSQIGEFAFVVLALAAQNNLLTQHESAIVLLAVIISMVVTPFVLKNLSFIADALAKELKNDDEETPTLHHEMKNHIILCGYGTFGQKIANLLQEMELNFIIIEHDKQLVEKGKKSHLPIFYGDVSKSSILESFYIHNATAVIIAIDNEKNLRIVCESIYAKARHANVIVKVANDKEMALLDDVPIKYKINEQDIIASMLIGYAMRCELGHTTPEDPHYSS